MPIRDRALRLTTDVVGAAAGRAGALVGRFQRPDPRSKALGAAAMKVKETAQTQNRSRSGRFTRDG